MPRKTRDVAANLTKKGFDERQGDHRYFHLMVDGVKTRVRTMISHGEKEIHDGLLGQMARDTKLAKRLFLDLVDCPMSAEQYVERLREQGDLPRPDGDAAEH